MTKQKGGTLMSDAFNSMKSEDKEKVWAEYKLFMENTELNPPPSPEQRQIESIQKEIDEKFNP